MCPDRSQASKEVGNSQAFTAEEKKCLFFLNEPLPGALRHVCTNFRANIRRTDCVGPILSQIERPNIHEKQVITMPSRDFCTLPYKGPNVHAVFER